ncbi:unnamed protein product [Malus baccata var. baccata]
MLVPSEGMLFHKEARKHRVRPVIKPKSQDKVLKIAATRKAEVGAIRCAAAIIAGEERRLLPPLLIIDLIFPPVIEHTGQESDSNSNCNSKDNEEAGSVPWKDLKVAMQPKNFGYVNNCQAERQFTFDELGEPLAQNESDHDRMLKLSSYVMTEYNDRLRGAEGYKAKLKENKQLMDGARKNKKLLTEAIQLKEQTIKRLTRWNGENVKLKKLFEATKKQLEVATLEASKVREELDGALVEVSELKRTIPTEREAVVQEYLGSQAFYHAIRPHCTREYSEKIDEYRQKGETFVLAVDPSSEEESDDKAIADEQTQQGKDDLEDTEDGGGTQSDIARGLTSYEDDS